MVVNLDYYQYMKNSIKNLSQSKTIPPEELLELIRRLNSENIILLWEQLINNEEVWKKFSVLCQYKCLFLSALLRELYFENPKSSGAALLLYDLLGGNSSQYQQRYLELFTVPSSEFSDIIGKL